MASRSPRTSSRPSDVRAAAPPGRAPACPPGLPDRIRREARALGFPQVGFCGTDPPGEVRHFERWIADGMHADMEWMARGGARRVDPGRVLEGARSFVVVALPYAPPSAGVVGAAPGGRTRGVVARYAHGDDYHLVMGDRLERLEEFIETHAPGHRALAYVDTGPILERLWAARAGIGWVGKNSLILNKDLGSYLFLGVVITTLPLPPDRPALDQCGACTLCIEACPTEAIVEPRLVDSRRCLSYHTIERRGPIPEEYRAPAGARVFGCDDCQDACPWNRQEGSTAPPGAFPPRAGSVDPSLLELLALTHDQYIERFRGSAMKRATFEGLRRNAAICLGNALAGGPPRGEDRDREGALRALRRVSRDPAESGVMRDHARWALRRAGAAP